MQSSSWLFFGAKRRYATADTLENELQMIKCRKHWLFKAYILGYHICLVVINLFLAITLFLTIKKWQIILWTIWINFNNILY